MASRTNYVDPTQWQNSLQPLETSPARVVNHRHSYSALSNYITEPITPTSTYSSSQSVDELDEDTYFELHRPSAAAAAPAQTSYTSSVPTFDTRMQQSQGCSVCFFPLPC
jgi:hypothetical protein